MTKKSEPNIQPLNDRVLVDPISQETETESGIIIPDTAKEERPQRGIVIAVGPGRRNKDGERIPLEIEVGQEIIFRKYSPDEIEVGEHKYYILSENDILAVVNK